MSKTSKKSSGTSTNLYLNGGQKAGVYSEDGNTRMYYNMSPWEQQSYDYAQKSFAQNLPNINVFSPQTIAELNKQVEAYKEKGVKNINDIYKPMIRNLQNDIAGRFGNLNNSVFMDKLSNLEDKRSDAISSLAQDVETRRQEVTNNELANRYNYLNFLNNYQNQTLQNMYDAFGMGSNANKANMGYSSSGSSSNSLNANAIINALMQVAGLTGR